MSENHDCELPVPEEFTPGEIWFCPECQERWALDDVMEWWK